MGTNRYIVLVFVDRIHNYMILNKFRKKRKMFEKTENCRNKYQLSRDYNTVLEKSVRN